VYRNGVMLGSADYTASSGLTVVLASGATAGDLVEVISFQVSSVLNAIPASPASVQTSYLVDGSVTTAKIADNSITTAKIAAGAVVQADLAAGVAGTGPAFSAYKSSNQTGISANTWTKAQLNVEDFDTASCFDNSTNYRFTPNVAGYYQINGNVSGNNSTAYMGTAIYKNGSLYTRTWSDNSQGMTAMVSAIIYFNGSTDYVELYGYMSDAGTFYSAGERGCFMSGAMVRAA
jgi:hypothetical protein